MWTLQAIGDSGQRTDDGDLICGGRPHTTLNVTEAHHVDASNSTFIQGGQTNVFSKTTNTVTYINTRASSLFHRLELVHHHIDASY